MAQKQAMVAAAVIQRPIADLTARVGQNPRVIARWVLEFSTETEISLGNLGLGVLYPTFGTVPEGYLGRFLSRNGKARGSP